LYFPRLRFVSTATGLFEASGRHTKLSSRQAVSHKYESGDVEIQIYSAGSDFDLPR